MDDASIAVISRAEAKAQGMKRYFTGKPCKHGHVAERNTRLAYCYECSKEKSKLFHLENRDKILEEMSVRNKAYYTKNQENIKAQTLKYQKDNASKRTSYKSAWSKQRAKDDPVYAMKLRLRKMLHRLYNVIHMKRKRTSTTEAELGYTAQEAKSHIERQFLRGMTWENHGKWHIDHIVPIGQFDITTDEGRKAANALTNLRPIWAKDNLRKSDAVLTLL